MFSYPFLHQILLKNFFNIFHFSYWHFLAGLFLYLMDIIYQKAAVCHIEILTWLSKFCYFFIFDKYNKKEWLFLCKTAISYSITLYLYFVPWIALASLPPSFASSSARIFLCSRCSISFLQCKTIETFLSVLLLHKSVKINLSFPCKHTRSPNVVNFL